MAKTRKQSRRKHRRGGGEPFDLNNDQWKKVLKNLEIKHEVRMAEAQKAINERLAEVAKMKAEKDAKKAAPPTRKQPARQAKSKSRYA
jgi:hypothetical protein